MAESLRKEIARAIFGATYAGKGRWDTLHKNVKIGWYREADQILSLIIKRVEGIENPFCDDHNSPDYQDLDIYQHSGFVRAIQAVIKELEESHEIDG